MDQLLLLSGGIDSISLAYMLRPTYSVTVNYGQICAIKEIEVSRKVSSELNIQHFVITANHDSIHPGSLNNTWQQTISPTPEWLPFRNQYIITLAGMRALQLGAKQIIIGTVKEDLQHCDGQPAFINTMSSLLKLQEGNIELSAPAHTLASIDLVHLSKIPLSLLSWAHSCHTSNYACGHCRGCYKYQDVFQQLHINA